jgi:hypothetical protein
MTKPMYRLSARPDTLMRRLRILLTALTLALSWQAHALTVELGAELLKNASGNPMPKTGLVLLVASTTDSTFNAPTPLSFVTGDDVIIGKWDLSAFGVDGSLDDSVNTTVSVNGNPLRLYWYPTLNINSTAPGQNTPYGTYRDIADPSQGATATATLSGSSVAGVTINSGGSTYHSAPSVTFSGGGGTGASATATITGGVVTAINVVNPGSGYTSAPTVTLSAPAALDGSAPWYGQGDSATITLEFLTTDANTGIHNPGSNPPSAGLASSNTPTAIAINSQPVNTTQNLGGVATFSVSASGTSLVYRWRKNGVNMSDVGNVTGSASANLTLSNVQASDVASYSVFITNSSAFVTSSSATLTVNDPYISTQPASANVNATGNANFSVTASGTGSLSYQWKKGVTVLSNGTQPSGAVVTGATTSSVTLSGVQQSDAANYSVVVTGAGGTVSSSAASLTVTDIAPVFSSPAADTTATLNAGSQIILSAAATGTTPLTYQWKKGASNLSNGAFANGATISGAATANLTLTGVLASDAGVYTCDAHNSVNDTLSHSTTINVFDPIITVQPTNVTAECNSDSPCLSVTAVGSTNLTYQWYSPNPSGTPIANATNATLCFNNISFASAGSYSVVVSNVYGGSITSSVATVTVTDTILPAVIVTGGTTLNLCKGDPYVEAGATATDNCDGPLTPSISGTVDTNTVGLYTITYTASDSHVNTANAFRVVNVHVCNAPDPSITSQPANQTVVVGQTGVMMNVAVSGTASSDPRLAGTGGFHFQWYFIGTTKTFPGVKMTGKTTATLSLSKIALTNAGTYYCYVTNALGNAYSDSTNYGKLTVYYAPVITGVANVTKVAGNIAIFKAAAGPASAIDPSLGGPFTFSWTKNNAPISTGGNVTIVDNGRFSTLTLTNVQQGDAGTYLCTVVNSSGQAHAATTPNDTHHGILTVTPDNVLAPAVAILHPSPNLRFTNGLPAYVGGGKFQGNAPDLDLDGNASDNGLITNLTLVRLQDTNIYNVPPVFRTNLAGQMLPGRVLWTNHVTLIDGTNTFRAYATDSGNQTNTAVVLRTYYLCTPVTVTINVQGTGKVTGVASLFGKPVQNVNTLFDQIGYKVTAVKTVSTKNFIKWTDGNGVEISSLPTLAFTATNNMVINANFDP